MSNKSKNKSKSTLSSQERIINSQNRLIHQLAMRQDQMNSRALKLLAKQAPNQQTFNQRGRRGRALVATNLGMTDYEALFAAAYLDPNHNNQVTRCVGIPDTASKPHTIYANTYTANVQPDANGNLALYLLPFAEVPLMQYDTSTKRFIAHLDPNFRNGNGDQFTFLKDSKVYGFRCFGQGLTVSNVSKNFDLQGSVTAARIPAIIDNHTLTDETGGTTYGTCYARTLEGLPITYQDVQSSVANAYVANAAYGCYLVNKNQAPDFPFVYRDGDWNKSTATIYHYDTTNGQILPTVNQSHETLSNYNVLAVSPKYPEGEIPQITPVKIVSSNGAEPHILNNSCPVSGYNGTGYMIGCVFFKGLAAGNAFECKVCHGYEFLVKPTTFQITHMLRPLPPSPYILEAVARESQTRTYQALAAAANSWGDIWNGFKKIVQSVKPLTTVLVDKLVPKTFKPIADAALSSIDNLTSDNAPSGSSANPGLVTPLVAAAPVLTGRRNRR